MTGTQNPDFSSLLSSDFLFVLLRFGIWLAFAVAVAGQVVAHDGFGWLVSCNKGGGVGGVGGGCSGDKRKCVLFDRTPFGQGKKTVILHGSLSEKPFTKLAARACSDYVTSGHALRLVTR